MPKYAIDEVNSDRVSGWCYEPGRPTSVLVMVDGRQVGQAVGGLFRVDVAQSIGEEAAITSGFDFRFRPEHFRHVNGNRAEVSVVVGDARTPPVLVPLLVQATTPPHPGPLPPSVIRLLTALDPSYAEPRWSEDTALRAADDLRFLVARGPRAVPELHNYLVFIAQLWVRASFVERYFPRENEAASLDAKDRSGVQNSGIEVFSVGAHLATLRTHGVSGCFLEFGCFKGFSTAILSDACHQLGMPMHVFDSFAGLPSSDSSYYRAGEFMGSLTEVQANVAAYGQPQVVEYHEGFFAETLPHFDAESANCIWMDVDLESSSRDAMQVFPRLDRRGVLFSHECPPELFADGRIEATRAPESVVPPILDAFAEAGRPVAGRHIHGHTGAFWDAELGIPPLPTRALLAVKDLALDL